MGTNSQGLREDYGLSSLGLAKTEHALTLCETIWVFAAPLFTPNYTTVFFVMQIVQLNIS